MKQSDFDKEHRALAKVEAKRRGWKTVSGTSYWSAGPLFFDLVQRASAKEGSFFGSLRFKWLELDSSLWRILEISSNENEPFILHANGAFVLTGQEILSFSRRSLEWLPGVLGAQVAEVMDRASVRAIEVAAQIDSIESYLHFVQKEHASFIERHPRAVTNVWKEALLVAMRTGDFTEASQIARSRIAARDTGGFSVGGKNFFERALDILEASGG